MKKLIALLLTILLLSGCGPAVYDGPTETQWVVTEIHTTVYISAGSETQVETFSYDRLGNKVKATVNSGGIQIRSRTWSYDDRGNCTEQVTREVPLFSTRIEYTYDEQDRLLTTTYRDVLRIKTGSETYTYDDEGATVTWDGIYDVQTKYLNENGDVLRVVSIGKDSGVEMETLYEYDEHGRNTSIIEYWDGNLSATTVMCYDELGRIQEQTTCSKSGEIHTHRIYRYTENTVTTLDDNGDQTVEYLRPDGQLEKREQYDRSGELDRVTEYFYTQIQVPAKEE